MFKRYKLEFDPQDHPEVIKALEVMYTDAYEAGMADALALVQEWLAELEATNLTADVEDLYDESYLDGVRDAILTVEQG